MDVAATANPLLSTQKPSDSGLQPILHPLVLLTISDYITRHTLREQPGPVVGALIGQQNGREVTIEHAFECATLPKDDGTTMLDSDWFEQRLGQMRTIHSSPQLDLVGWYTLFPRSGPTPNILAIHEWILDVHNESSLLLGFHPEESVKHDAGSRLPLTIYESNYEAEELKNEQGEDREMRDGEPPLKLRFRELPYAVETGEAEMISMDFVARGAGNATAVEPRAQKKMMPGNLDDPKGKRKMEVVEPTGADVGTADGEGHVLSREDEEMIAALTAKANSVKMLQSRINLLATYLERLPPSCLTGDDTTMATGEGEAEPTIPSHTILRSIQALVNRLSLVVPSATEAFEQEMLSEANDVGMMELLNGILQNATEIRTLGKKFNIVESGRNQNRHADDSRALGSRYAEI
ncbi:putative signalosome subunit [Rosellinia necatrix]|uniref:COP9 signalosome complex subunit 6 n=1 Tax=Rosellinia necatrix TaxID=77044 RepID=A0A1S7UHL8_ROSNE|nr:putative signalosome subunit [Rosellinia necatrix]